MSDETGNERSPMLNAEIQIYMAKVLPSNFGVSELLCSVALTQQ